MMQSFTHDGQDIKYRFIGDASVDIAVIWGHGWGMDHQSLFDVAQPLAHIAGHYVVDFPGFGASPVPKTIWGPEDYAEFMAAFIKSLPQKTILWVGHSFGCRVGVHLASRYPRLLSGMCLTAAAGLKRKRPFYKSLYFKFRILLYKSLKKITRLGLSETWLKSKFGSADYRNAGLMRDILVRTVNEDLSEAARSIQCPTLLVYGSKDDQTPPEMGERYHKFISGSEFIQLEGYDHYSILTSGRHQIARLVKSMIEQLR